MEKATAFCVCRVTATDIKVMNSLMNVIFPQNYWTQSGDFVRSKVYRHKINNEKLLFQHPIINILLCRYTLYCFCTPIASNYLVPRPIRHLGHATKYQFWWQFCPAKLTSAHRYHRRLSKVSVYGGGTIHYCLGAAKEAYLLPWWRCSERQRVFDCACCQLSYNQQSFWYYIQNYF